ncbi:MAG TPA: class I SAM-dependent methyltransferase [Acidimicrobiia bacterium]|nr:class I SAM-dependent methyltransferase [Acidimicrobiia bacterium]
MTMQEIMGRNMQALTQMEAVAALIARLKLDASSQPGDPRVREQLDRVVDAMGLTDVIAALQSQERMTVIGATSTMMAQALDLVAEPGRAPGWSFTDPMIIQGIGGGSTMVAGIIAGGAIGKPDARILDIGTGVGLLAVAFCRTFPESTVVGIDPWEPSLAFARKNVADAGLDARIALLQTTIEHFDDADGFDLVWMPVMFLAEAILDDALAHAVRALRPGGELVMGRFISGGDPLTAALGDLRTVRSGGTLLTEQESAARLERAGLIDVRELPRTTPAPLGFTVGRKP